MSGDPQAIRRLVRELRDYAKDRYTPGVLTPLLTEAADTITGLTKKPATPDIGERSFYSRDLGSLLESANRLLSPKADRTFDDLIRDSGQACDLVRSALSALSKGAEAPGSKDGWQPIETAPRGLPSESVGCRQASEWFIGRVSEKYRREGRPPIVTIRRRAWPQEDAWAGQDQAYYVSDFFDAWRPTPPQGRPVSDFEREKLKELCHRLDTENTGTEPQKCADTMDEARLAILAQAKALEAKDAEIERLKGDIERHIEIASNEASARLTAEAALKEAREAGDGIMFMANEWKYSHESAGVPVTEASLAAIERANLIFDSGDDRALLSKQDSGDKQ